MNISSQFLGGLIIGTVVGVATGLLIAPSSGASTRRKLVKNSRVYSTQAIDAVRQYLENIRNTARKDEGTTPKDKSSSYSYTHAQSL